MLKTLFPNNELQNIKNYFNTFLEWLKDKPYEVHCNFNENYKWKLKKGFYHYHTAQQYAKKLKKPYPYCQIKIIDKDCFYRNNTIIIVCSKNHLMPSN